jgi:hypothetical protein
MWEVHLGVSLWGSMDLALSMLTFLPSLRVNSLQLPLLLRYPVSSLPPPTYPSHPPLRQECEQCGNMKYQPETEVVTVSVEPGMPNGHEISFFEEGGWASCLWSGVWGGCRHVGGRAGCSLARVLQEQCRCPSIATATHREQCTALVHTRHKVRRSPPSHPCRRAPDRWRGG